MIPNDIVLCPYVSYHLPLVRKLLVADGKYQRHTTKQCAEGERLWSSNPK